jgi:hypothetical protein
MITDPTVREPTGVRIQVAAMTAAATAEATITPTTTGRTTDGTTRNPTKPASATAHARLAFLARGWGIGISMDPL